MTALALDQAREDLEMAGFPGYAGKLFHPVREEILIPVTSWAADHTDGDTVPDHVGGAVVDFVCKVVKGVYGILPHDKPVDKEVNKTIFDEVEEIGSRGMFELQQPNTFLSFLMGAVGFAFNTVIDIATLPVRGKIMEWISVSIQFFGYLLYAQVGRELVKAYGNTRGLLNLAIIGNVQVAEQAIACESNREKTAMDHLPDGVTDTVFKRIIQDAARYVRFATAAYGTSMIDSADLLQVFGKNVLEADIVHESSKDYRKRKISRYINVEESCIPVLTPPGGSMELLGHFVAFDQRLDSLDGKPAVVVAIRGTYTPSCLIIDSTAYSTRFCDGVLAHAGIVKRANTLWASVKDVIIGELTKHPNHDLVITGHSLGAGAAALLAFKLNYEGILAEIDPKLKDVKVKCFAFAPPPVVFQICKGVTQQVKEAMQSTYAFIHENDCVPFLSVDSVRRLAVTTAKVDQCNRFNPLGRARMAADIGISDEVKNVVNDGSRQLQPAPDADRLAIPAPFVVWMRQIGVDVHQRPTYDSMFCRPQRDLHSDSPGTNDLSILIHPRMISDHMNPQYERAVNSILEQIIKGKGPGYIFPKCCCILPQILQAEV